MNTKSKSQNKQNKEKDAPIRASTVRLPDGGALKESFPFVSVCTPTFNRRPFISTIIQCFRRQTYPKDRMEWIIVDDGTDPIQDVLNKHATDLLPLIRYFRIPTKMTLGKKRNYMHEQAKGDILVYMDDDDYYPPTRVEHAVRMLQCNPQALCAGSSIIHLFFKPNKMMEFGPYGPNHATAGTFAFRRELLSQTRYDDEACLAEERQFLKDYTIPFVQLEPKQTILVFSHEHNSFDKRKLLALGGPSMRERPDLKVVDFIRLPEEEPIRRFFLTDIDGLLKKYKAGEPSSKPDVMKQTIELEKKRDEMAKQMAGQQAVLTVNPPNGGEPIHLNMDQVVQILKNHEETIVRLQEINQQQKQYIEQQANHIADMKKQVLELGKIKQPDVKQSEPKPITILLDKHIQRNKSDPEVSVSLQSNSVFDIM